MRNLLSFSTKKEFWGLFAWVWVKAHFPLESSFIDLIHTNHHLIHLQKCQHCEFSTLFNIVWKKIFITNLSFFNEFTVFCWCLLKVKQSILFVNQKYKLYRKQDGIKNGKSHTNLCDESCFISYKNHRLKVKL